MAVQIRKGRFKVGDWVYLDYGVRHVRARIVEERGPLGKGGRLMYGLHIPQEGGADYTEAREDHLEPVQDPAHEQVVAYLRDGGLFAILRAHTYAGPEPPSVYLTYSPRDGFGFSPIAGRGFVGGGLAPIGTLAGDRIRADRVAEVLDFLAGFGLSPDEAQAVVAAVGTSEG